jgi:large subunit ribosomal protein L10
MPTEAKRETVADLSQAFAASRAAIVSEYRGLTVADLSRVRRELREKGITYRVVKNRLAKIAAQDAGRSELVPLLTGPIAITLGGSDESALARATLDALRPFRSIVVRGGSAGGRAFDADSVNRLATLPSREVLLAQLAGGIASPVSTLAGLFAAPLRGLAYAFAQVRDQREAAA